MYKKETKHWKRSKILEEKEQKRERNWGGGYTVYSVQTFDVHLLYNAPPNSKIDIYNQQIHA